MSQLKHETNYFRDIHISQSPGSVLTHPASVGWSLLLLRLLLRLSLDPVAGDALLHGLLLDGGDGVGVVRGGEGSGVHGVDLAHDGVKQIFVT